MKLLCALALALVLSACGGGGGGGGSSGGGVVVTPFTGFSYLQPNTTVFAAAAYSTDVTYNSNIVNGYVTSKSAPTVTSGTAGSTSGVGATETLNGSTLATSLNITSGAGTNATWSISAGDSLTNVTRNTSTVAVYALNAARTNEALYVYGPGMGWSYQTYGIWITGEGTGAGNAGAMSVGAISPASGIPTTGTATFTGTSGGVYVAASGQPFLTLSDMTAATNFGTRQITFNTTNTIISAFNGSGASAQTGLDLSGTLAYSAGTNSFNGTVTTANSALTGSAFGKFYGPSATEVGGIYNVTAGSGLQSMSGAFGGKR
jgi:hypothetical protein